MKEKISIIIPVHNGQKYIRACVCTCIESVLERNEARLFDLEIIIIDDGSTDKTATICEALKREYHDKAGCSVSILTTEDLGVSASRNSGISLATGNYIAFLDADDRLLPGCLSVLYRIASQSKSNIVGCGFAMWHSEEEYRELSTRPFVIDDIASWARTYDSHEYLDKGILTNDTRCWSKLYRSEIIKDLKFDENLSIGEDMLFLVGAVSKAGTITVTDWQGYAYFQNPDGATLRPFTSKYMDQITCWQLALKEIIKLRPELEPRLVARIITAVILIVGKMAVLPKKERLRYQAEVDRCSQCLAETRQMPEAFKLLPWGYRIKVRAYRVSPRGYMGLYGILKKGIAARRPQ
ncbi:MAG: glycosyltransferase family 2 protein [Lachnospiraceae bacterium]|nr:glycosyltransferase family 2 protein [Lachnospiraceae bacterium]